MIVKILEEVAKVNKTTGNLIGSTRVLIMCDNCLEKEWETSLEAARKRKVDLCLACRNSLAICGVKEKGHSEETKKKLSKLLKGKGCGKLNSMYGKKHSEETKSKMRQNHYDNSGENHYLYGGHHSEKTKEKMQRSRKGYKHSEETKQKIAEGNKGKIVSEQERARLAEMSRTAKRIFSDTSIEVMLHKALNNAGIPFEKQKIIFGRPDIFIEPNICIFADGDYWHNLPGRQERDAMVNERLTKDGYIVLRFWGSMIKNSIEECLQKIKQMVEL